MRSTFVDQSWLVGILNDYPSLSLAPTGVDLRSAAPVILLADHRTLFRALEGQYEDSAVPIKTHPFPKLLMTTSALIGER